MIQMKEVCLYCLALCVGTQCVLDKGEWRCQDQEEEEGKDCQILEDVYS